MCSRAAKGNVLGTIAIVAIIILILGAGIFSFVSKLQQKVGVGETNQTASRSVAEQTKAAAIDPRVTAIECSHRIYEVIEMVESFSMENDRYPTAAEYTAMMKDKAMAKCPADNSLYEYIPDAVRSESNGRVNFTTAEPGKEDPLGKFAIWCSVHSEAGDPQVFGTEEGVYRLPQN